MCGDIDQTILEGLVDRGYERPLASQLAQRALVEVAPRGDRDDTHVQGRLHPPQRLGQPTRMMLSQRRTPRSDPDQPASCGPGRRRTGPLLLVPRILGHLHATDYTTAVSDCA